MSGSTPAIQQGSIADMCRRMRAVLPSSWFPAVDGNGSSTPILDAILSGMGYGWAAIFAMLQYLRVQTRLATATGSFLDIASADFFGGRLPRQPGDTDATFRTKLLTNLLVDKATRSALIATLLRVSGTTPIVQEPRQGVGLGGYGHGGYNVSGFALGNATMPFQLLVTCFPSGVYSTRQSSATFVNAGGKIGLAPMYSLREDYSTGSTAIVLAEDRGFNMIKDSLGWKGIEIPWTSGNATVVGVDASAPYGGATTVAVSIGGAGEYQGPAAAVAVADQTVTGSVWIKTTGVGQFLSLYLRITDEKHAVSVAAIGAAAAGSWQRCSVTHTRSAATPGSVTMDIVAATTGAGCGLATQCWQVEVGQQMTSFIPSSGTIGIREADQAVPLATIPLIPVDRFTRDDILVRTLPAGTVAWVRDIS